MSTEGVKTIAPWTPTDGQDLQDGRIWTPLGRLSFPALFEAAAMKDVADSKAKFSCNMLFPKTNPLRLLKILTKNAVVKKFGEDKNKWPANLKSIDWKTFLSITGKEGWPFRDGDALTYDGYAGMISVKAANESRPAVWGSAVMDVPKEEVYAGCYGRALISAYGWTHQKGGKGVNFSLLAFQKIKDGEPFAVRASLSDYQAFDEMADSEGSYTDTDEF